MQHKLDQTVIACAELRFTRKAKLIILGNISLEPCKPLRLHTGRINHYYRRWAALPRAWPAFSKSIRRR
ncbi:hypothetical protein AN403_5966 [Pseudomonas fluorescens]|uniref:Uncharacterized protein n=1 Tax=Pseudomonas fluorescens TaxID=294 RepID=A0A0P9BFV9_PSEFL|nr:hypothetical protein AN403_5966 [Pseudomonas fluorescens]